MAKSAYLKSSRLKVSRGFTLTELAMSLAIIALLLGFFLTATPALMTSQKIRSTEARIALVEAAFTQYGMQNKRLPCPANGTIPNGSATVGTETARDVNGDCVSQTNGVAPWVALGLAAVDIEDGWGVRLTYRVASGLTRNNALDMSGCDPAGSAPAVGTAPNKTCAPNCTAATLTTNCTPPAAFVAGKGFNIRDAVGGNLLMDPSATPSNGVAFVLISHGENQSGGYASSGVLLAAIGAQQGTNEAPNRADQALATDYIDATRQYSDTSARFDDFVVRPSVMTVINRAALGPRAHY